MNSSGSLIPLLKTSERKKDTSVFMTINKSQVFLSAYCCVCEFGILSPFLCMQQLNSVSVSQLWGSIPQKDKDFFFCCC